MYFCIKLLFFRKGLNKLFLRVFCLLERWTKRSWYLDFFKLRNMAKTLLEFSHIFQFPFEVCSCLSVDIWDLRVLANIQIPSLIYLSMHYRFRWYSFHRFKNSGKQQQLMKEINSLFNCCHPFLYHLFNPNQRRQYK